LNFYWQIGIYNLSIRPGYLTDNRGTKNRISSVKWSERYCGLSVYHFNNIKDGLVAASKS